MKKTFKKVFAILCVVMMMATLGITCFATDSGDTADVAVSAMKSALGEVTSTLSIGNILTILGALIGACIVLVFFWWGLRKLIGAVMTAFKKGRLSV